MKKHIYIGTALLAMALPLGLGLRNIHTKTGESDGQSAFIGGGMEQRRMNTPVSSQQPIDISMIRLIANPAAYDGKYVRVIGFVRVEFEGTAVYLHQEDYKLAISKNALWLAIDRDNQQAYMKGNQKYVLIEGTFDAKYAGHRGLFSGTIKDIQRFQVWAEPSAQR